MTASAISLEFQRMHERVAQLTMHGVTTSPASALGTHHSSTLGNNCSHGIVPPYARLTTLKAALTVVPRKHASPMYPVTSRVRSIALSNVMILLSRKTQTIEPMVLPTAVPS